MKRVAFIDVARGLAVLLMILIHSFNSWVDPALRGSATYRLAQHLGGFAAPGFLLLAGVGLGFKFQSAVRRGRSLAESRRSALHRGALIFLLAYVFRFQEWLLAGAKGAAAQLLKVDVLNCIGASLMLVALVGLRGGARALRPGAEPPQLDRPWRALAWASFFALATPLIWKMPLPGGYWQALTGYVGGDPKWSAFPLFPWAAYAFAGLAVGVLWSAAAGSDRPALGTSVLRVTLTSLALALLGWGLHTALVPYVGDASNASQGWTSPARFAYRLGAFLVATGLLYVLEQARWVPLWETVRRMGQASLLIYWVHVDLVYGRFSRGWRRELSLGETALGLLLLLISMALLGWARTSGYLKLPSWLSLRPGRRAAGSDSGAGRG